MSTVPTANSMEVDSEGAGLNAAAASAPADVSGEAAPIVVPPVAIAPPLPALTRGEGVAIALAASLHVALITSMLMDRATRVGAGGADVEVIAVEIVESIGLRTTVGDRSDSNRSRPDPVEGDSDPAPERAASRSAGAAEAAAAEPPPAALPEPEEAAAEAPRAIVAPRVGEGDAREGEKQADEGEEARREAGSEASAPSPEAGGGLRGTHAIEVPGIATATASGAAQEYAVRVVGVLASSRPKLPRAARGTVRIVFAVSPGGDPIGVRIKLTSGDPRLDDAVLAAVRELRFPPPPAGLRSADLLYEVPYILR